MRIGNLRGEGGGGGNREFKRGGRGWEGGIGNLRGEGGVGGG